jgi:hypothetical protein
MCHVTDSLKGLHVSSILGETEKKMREAGWGKERSQEKRAALPVSSGHSLILSESGSVRITSEFVRRRGLGSQAFFLMRPLDMSAWV